MDTINFPKMFRGNATVVNRDNDSAALLQGLHLLLSSEAGTLFGDPDFGLRLRRYLFEPNNYILRDILIDEIYTQITTFFPQVYLERKNITIEQSGYKLYVNIKCKNQKTFENNMFNLVLYEIEETE